MQTRLEAFIRHAAMTQAQLGEKLGVSAPAVSRYAAGERQPRRRVGERLSALTHGEIHAANCAEPISDVQAAEMMAEIARREAAAKAGEVAGG